MVEFVLVVAKFIVLFCNLKFFHANINGFFASWRHQRVLDPVLHPVLVEPGLEHLSFMGIVGIRVEWNIKVMHVSVLWWHREEVQIDFVILKVEN
jgi:hypothetical protein